MTALLVMVSVISAAIPTHAVRVPMMLEPATCPTPVRVRLQLEEPVRVKMRFEEATPPPPVQVKLRLTEPMPSAMLPAAFSTMLIGGLFGGDCPGGVCPPRAVGRVMTAVPKAIVAVPQAVSATLNPPKAQSCPCGPTCPCGNTSAMDGAAAVIPAANTAVYPVARAGMPCESDKPRRGGLLKRIFGGKCK